MAKKDQDIEDLLNGRRIVIPAGFFGLLILVYSGTTYGFINSGGPIVTAFGAILVGIAGISYKWPDTWGELAARYFERAAKNSQEGGGNTNNEDSNVVGPVRAGRDVHIHQYKGEEKGATDDKPSSKEPTRKKEDIAIDVEKASVPGYKVFPIRENTPQVQVIVVTVTNVSSEPVVISQLEYELPDKTRDSLFRFNPFYVPNFELKAKHPTEPFNIPIDFIKFNAKKHGLSGKIKVMMHCMDSLKTRYKSKSITVDLDEPDQ